MFILLNKVQMIYLCFLFVKNYSIILARALGLKKENECDYIKKLQEILK